MKIFNRIFGKPIEKNKENLPEYSFIWYKEMKYGRKIFYTQPFRTKVKARNFDEAKNKIFDFAMSKMKLVVIPEEQFKHTDIAKFDEINKKMDALHKEMEDMINNFNV